MCNAATIKAVNKDKTLSRLDQVVFAAIFAEANAQGLVMTSLAAINEAVNGDKKWVAASIKKLEAAGHIQRQPTKSKRLLAFILPASNVGATPMKIVGGTPTRGRYAHDEKSAYKVTGADAGAVIIREKKKKEEAPVANAVPPAGGVLLLPPASPEGPLLSFTLEELASFHSPFSVVCEAYKSIPKNIRGRIAANMMTHHLPSSPAMDALFDLSHDTLIPALLLVQTSSLLRLAERVVHNPGTTSPTGRLITVLREDLKTSDLRPFILLRSTADADWRVPSDHTISAEPVSRHADEQAGNVRRLKDFLPAK